MFRTNSSYGRWDEARKLWGSVTNRSRDFVRQVRVSYQMDAFLRCNSSLTVRMIAA